MSLHITYNTALGRFIPYLIAKKGKKEIILEVETKNTDKSDADQQKAFKKYSKERKREFLEKR